MCPNLKRERNGDFVIHPLLLFSSKMSQSNNIGEQMTDDEEEDELGEDFEAAYSRAQKEFTREAITNSCCIFVFF